MKPRPQAKKTEEWAMESAAALFRVLDSRTVRRGFGIKGLGFRVRAVMV